MKGFEDPMFPTLAAALDTDAVLEQLVRELPELRDELEPVALSASDVRYEPGRRCELLFRLKARVGRTGRTATQLLAATIVPEGKTPAAVPQALLERYARHEDRLLRTPTVYLDSMRMAVRAFPLDPELPWLFDALQADVAALWLDRTWRERKARVRRVRPELLGYTPGARAALSMEVHAEARSTREPELRHLIAKMHAKKDAARLFAGSWAVWRAARGRVSLAPPVGFSSALNLSLQERVAGERLGGLAGETAFRRRMRETARAIATLHAIEIPLPTRRKPGEEAGVVLRWSAVLAAIRPDLAHRIEALRDQLVGALETRVELKGPVHGDFHHTNVLVDGDRITIIDLDEMALGDPALDVGRFMASTRIPSLRTFGTTDGLEESREEFLEEYMRRNPEDQRRVRLFEAASLFTSAASAFRIQRAGWYDEVELLLADAERVASLAGAGARAAASPVEVAAYKPTADPSAWLADRLYMRAALASEIDRTYGAHLTSCRVVSTSGDGDRFEYDLAGWVDDAKWKLRVEAHRTEAGGAGLLQRLERLHDALRDVPGAPGLPRPIGFIRALSAMVFEAAPRGTTLAALLGTPDGLRAAGVLGTALATLHGSHVELPRARTLEWELKRIRRRIEQARRVDVRLAHRAEALHTEVERRSGETPGRVGPVLRVIHPQHVLWQGSRVAFDRVEDVILSHPLIDAGDFLARVELTGLRQNRRAAAGEAAAAFRSEYHAAGGLDLDRCAPVEAATLIRLACSQLVRASGAEAAGQLLDRAEEVLE
ncbi:MAG TPA: phosphotransferase [Longimicrobiales bacterium]|nr:phosphotransferase [Longimicrobiales bacterium]